MKINKLVLLLLLPALLLLSSCTAKKAERPKSAPQPAVNQNTESEPLMVLQRDQVLSGPLPDVSKSPEDAVRRYAAAQFTRDTKELLVSITGEMADKTGMSTFPYPSFGQSSPWVEQAEIWQEKSPSVNTWNYRIRYRMATSQGVLGTRTEDVEVIKVSEEYLVSNSSLAPSGASGDSTPTPE